MLLEVDRISCAYAGADVLADVTLQVGPQDVVGVIGPNGAGKSTLLRAMSRVLRPRLGRALLDGRDLYDGVPAGASARSIAVVGQDEAPAFEFTSLDIVLMGRSPHLGRFQTESARDLEIARRAMERTGTWDLRERPVTALSAGERQRVILARALAQEPRVLLLDEPTAHLDPAHQIEILRLVRGLGCAVVAVLHDFNLAAAFCARIVLMEKGRIVARGTPEEVLTRELLGPVFGLELDVERRQDRLVVLPRLS